MNFLANPVVLSVTIWVLEKQDSQVSLVFRSLLGIKSCGKEGGKAELSIENRTGLHIRQPQLAPPVALELKWPVRVNPGGTKIPRPLSFAFDLLCATPRNTWTLVRQPSQLEQFLKDWWGIQAASLHVHTLQSFNKILGLIIWSNFTGLDTEYILNNRQLIIALNLFCTIQNFDYIREDICIHIRFIKNQKAGKDIFIFWKTRMLFQSALNIWMGELMSRNRNDTQQE